MKQKKEAWTAEEREAVELIVINKSENFQKSSNFFKYPLFANGAGLFACFTTLGAGWDKAGVVRVVTDIIPFFLVGLIFGGLTLFLHVSYDDVVALIARELRKNSWSTKGKHLYNLAQWLGLSIFISFLCSSVLFFGSVYYAAHDERNYNFSAQSKLEFSTPSFDLNDISFSVLNVGERGALITYIDLSIVSPKTSHLELLTLPKDQSPFVLGGSERDFSLTLSNQFEFDLDKKDAISILSGMASSNDDSSLKCKFDISWTNFSGDLGERSFPLDCSQLSDWATLEKARVH